MSRAILSVWSWRPTPGCDGGEVLSMERTMWRLMTAGAAAAAGGCLRSAYERKNFVTDIYEVKSEKVSRERTFMFLSDLHDNCFGIKQERLLAAIDKVRPQAVLVGGDMMVVKKKADLGITLSLMGELAAKYPVFYANGNHESRMYRKRQLYGDSYDVFLRGLKDAGVCHLSDAWAD